MKPPEIFNNITFYPINRIFTSQNKTFTFTVDMIQSHGIPGNKIMLKYSSYCLGVEIRGNN